MGRQPPRRHYILSQIQRNPSWRENLKHKSWEDRRTTGVSNAGWNQHFSDNPGGSGSGERGNLMCYCYFKFQRRKQRKTTQLGSYTALIIPKFQKSNTKTIPNKAWYTVHSVTEPSHAPPPRVLWKKETPHCELQQTWVGITATALQTRSARRGSALSTPADAWKHSTLTSQIAPGGVSCGLDLLLLLAEKRKWLRFINPRKNIYLPQPLLVLVLVTVYFRQKNIQKGILDYKSWTK